MELEGKLARVRKKLDPDKRFIIELESLKGILSSKPILERFYLQEENFGKEFANPAVASSNSKVDNESESLAISSSCYYNFRVLVSVIDNLI